MTRATSLRLFGPPTILGPDGPIGGRSAQRHRLALLALLARSPAATASRDRLTAYLWPEMETAGARHLLNVSVHVLRKALGKEVLLSEGDDLRLDTLHLPVDAVDFEAALARGEPARAVELYGGPFLDGFHLGGAREFEKWLDAERATLAVAYRRALERLAEVARARGEPVAEVEWRRQLAAEDPYNTRYVLELMEALESAGDRGNALQVAREHEALLREELGAEPDPALEALVHRLRTRPNGTVRDAASVEGKPRDGGVGETPRLQRSIPPGTVREAALVARDVREGPTSVRRRPASAMPGSGGAWKVATGIAAVALLAAVVGLELSRLPGATPASRERVAVAPFENATADSSFDLLGAMAADWITVGLSRSGLLEVVDPLTMRRSPDAAGAERRKGAGASGRALRLAESAGAGILVHGSLTLRGDSLEATARVVDTGSGRVLGVAQRAVAPRTESRRLLEALRSRVIGALSAIVDPRLAAVGHPSSPPPTYEAYREYSTGLDLFSRGLFSEALPHFYRSYEMDSAFALPLRWAAMAEWNAGSRGYPGGVARSDSLVRFLEARRDRLPPLEVHGLDYVLARGRGDRPAARVALERAVELAPGSQYALMLARDRLRSGRYREAADLLVGMDPERGWVSTLAGYWDTLGDVYHMLGRHDRELETVERWAASSSRSAGEVDEGRVAALAALGRIASVEDLVAARIDADPEDPEVPGLFDLAIAEFLAHGHRVEAREMAERCLDWESGRPPTLREPGLRFLRARCLHLADRLEEARRVLESLVDEEPPSGALLDRIRQYGDLGVVQARMGDEEAARRTSDRLRTLPRDPRMISLIAGGADSVHIQRTSYERARIAAALGAGAEAVRLLRRVEAGGLWYNRMDVRRAIHRDRTDFARLEVFPSLRTFVDGEPEGTLSAR